MPAEYHVVVEHQPSRTEPRGWTVSIVRQDGRLVQVVARDRSEKEACDMARPVALAFRRGAQEAGEQALRESIAMICEASR